MIIKVFRARRRFRYELAKATPLINGRETKKVSAAIGYDADRALKIIRGEVVPFDPRNTFPDRLLVAL